MAAGPQCSMVAKLRYLIYGGTGVVWCGICKGEGREEEDGQEIHEEGDGQEMYEEGDVSAETDCK